MFTVRDTHLYLKMKEEISAAVNFILKLTKQNSELSDELLKKFEKCLNEQLHEKFKNHWHPEKPFLGQGYRCLRLNGINGKEPTIAKAAINSGVNYADLKLPIELTVWVDPAEVCCRFGEHKGSYCTIASFNDGNKEDFVDQINISRLTSTETDTCSEDGTQTDVTSKRKSSFPKESIACKENIAPVPKLVSPKMSVNPQNLRNSMSPSQNCNRVSGRILNGCSPPFIYDPHLVSSQGSFQSNNTGIVYAQSDSFAYYKNNSWGVDTNAPNGCHQTIYNSNAYVNYSPLPSHFSSQENFNLNRMSPPMNINKLRWNSGPIMDVNGNQYMSERHGWYYPRQLARV